MFFLFFTIGITLASLKQFTNICIKLKNVTNIK